MSRTVKVFVTKYALTQGIKEVEGERCEAPMEHMFKPKGQWAYYHGLGKEWHYDKAGAVEMAGKNACREDRWTGEAVGEVSSDEVHRIGGMTP